MADTYYDLDLATGGAGTEADPKDASDLETDVNALSGDQGGDRILIKRGSEGRVVFSVNSVSNLTMTTYGSGARPIINISSLVNSANWTAHSNTNTWYLTSITTASRLHVPESVVDYMPRAASLAAMTNWTWFWDSGTNRVYIRTDGTDPADIAVEISDNIHAAFGDCTDLTFIGLHFTKGQQRVLQFSASAAVALNNNKFFNCKFSRGGSGVASDQALNYKSGSSAAKATGVEIRHCEIEGMANNCFEIGYLDGAVISDNTATWNTSEIQTGTFVEMWQECDNCIIERNVAGYMGGQAFWLQSPSGGGPHDHTGNIFRNNLMHHIGLKCHRLNNGTNNQFYNNTIHVDGDTLMCEIVGGSGWDIRNNIFSKTSSTNSSNIITITSGATHAGMTINNNYYHNEAGDAKFTDENGSYVGLTAWQASADGWDANSIEDADPFNNISTNDFTLSSSSKALYETTAGAAVVTQDINQHGREGGVDLGPYQTPRIPEKGTAVKV